LSDRLRRRLTRFGFGGPAFQSIVHDGEVAVHEGWLTEKEARQLRKADAGEEGAAESAAVKPGKSELTNKMRNYVGLHKHAAVRTELLAHPGIALRLSVTHIIAGSDRRHDRSGAKNRG